VPPESHNQKAQTAAAERRAILEVKELFKKEGMEIADNEIPTLKLHTPGKPPFPILMLLLTVPKDIADMFTLITDGAAVTGIGLILLFIGRAFATAFSAIVALVLFLWLLGKINIFQKAGVRWMGRKFAQWAMTRWLGATVAETIAPAFPMATILVLFAHYRENKYIGLLLTAADKIGRAFKGGKLKMK